MLDWLTPLVFLGRAQRKLCRRGIPLFSWHRVSVPPRLTRDPFLYNPPEQFGRQLAQLRQAGWQSVSLAKLRRGEASPGKVVLTFDDGCANVLENGLPLLQDHGLRAIQFLVAGRIGGRNEWDVRKGDVPERLMTVEEVRRWLAGGMEIGSHSLTHQNLRHLTAGQAREEIAASKKKLEDLFAVPILHFSYPYGSWNEQVRDLVGEAGYETACTMDFGVNQASTPMRELKRIIPLSSAQLLRKARHRVARNCGW